MQHFVDREQELQTLQAEYDRPGSALVVLYGRRRVGKTTLISEFIREKPALFFLASEESEPQNRTVFKEKTAEFLNNDLLRSALPTRSQTRSRRTASPCVSAATSS